MTASATPSEPEQPLADLSVLGEEVLGEVVREAEQMVDAQFAAIVAGDQRALTLGGLAATLAGAAAGLLVAKEWPVGLVSPELLAGVLVAEALILIAAAAIAVAAAMPSRFLFPGNEPANWHPEHWPLSKGAKYTLKAARIEQAIVLQAKIDANRRAAIRQARLVRTAVQIAFTAIGGGIAVIVGAFLVGLWR